MNFDRLNPLSSYLSRNTKHEEPKKTEMSDWGIEETESTPSQHSFSHSRHALNNHYFDDVFDPPQPQYYQTHSTTSHSGARHESTSSLDFKYYYEKYGSNPIAPSTENFSKFIRKYLSVDNNEFWEKFKYNLIISNLLDDSMILSKNEQALKNLGKSSGGQHQPTESFKYDSPVKLPTFINYLNYDGTELNILDKNYRLHCSPVLYNSKYIIIIINLIIHLLKQRQLFEGHYRVTTTPQSQLKMFKILLIISAKLIKFKKFKLTIKTNQTMHMLNDFLIYNYKLNIKLTTNLINLKEISVYNNINGKDYSKNIDLLQHKEDLKSSLSHSLGFLNFNLKTSIIKLFPYLNGELFEQYCSINNIKMEVLTTSFDAYTKRINEEDFTHMDRNPTPLDEIVFNINKFNQLRKFFVCQLLTINESPIKKNFFIYRLMDQFGVEDSSQHNFTFLHKVQKLDLLRDVFSEHILVLKNFNSLFERFDSLSSNKSISKGQHEDVTSLDTVEQEKDSNLNNLVTKLSNLATNMKFFQKYNQSTKTIDNIDELNEKLMIFKQFSDDIDKVKEMYLVNLTDLNNETYQSRQEYAAVPESRTSSRSNSARSSPRSSIDNSTGLKSFHNSAIKKRYSLPSAASSLFKAPLPSTLEAREMDCEEPVTPQATAFAEVASPGKKYKKLSTGLQLGLLTVFEDPKRNSNESVHSGSSAGTRRVGAISNATMIKQTDAQRNGVSYDDNYINILPPPTYETYNQLTLDQLSSNNNNITNNNSNNNNNNNSNNNTNNTTNNNNNNNQNYRKMSFGNLMQANRFSMNSVNSNLSGLTDLINSTRITSLDENGAENESDGVVHDNFGSPREDLSQQISKAELKLRLEESFNRIYTLENENKVLKSKTVNERSSTNSTFEESSTNHDQDTIKSISYNNQNRLSSNAEATITERLDFSVPSAKDMSFLSDLEKKLHNKLHDEPGARIVKQVELS